MFTPLIETDGFTPIFDEMMREIRDREIATMQKAFDAMIEPINYATDAVKDFVQVLEPVHDPRKNQALLHKKAVARRKKRKRGGHK